MSLILDLEANGLRPDKIWVVSTYDTESKERRSFKKVYENYGKLREFLTQYIFSGDEFVGHNFIGYDLGVLNRLVLHDDPIPPNRVLDTLVVSRLTDFSREGGHGLEQYGKELGFPKPPIEDWSVYSEDMVSRCEADVEINRLLLEKQRPFIESPLWQLSLKIEHSTANFCKELHDGGFPFDISAAVDLFDRWGRERYILEDNFQKDFPSRYELVREITPKYTKAGVFHRNDFKWFDGDPDASGLFSIGCPFSFIQGKLFDPASNHSIIDRLWEHGWKPSSRTKGHTEYLRTPKKFRTKEKDEAYCRYGWSIDDLNLATLPAEAPQAAKNLVRWKQLAGLQAKLQDCLNNYNEDTGAIHGQFFHIGASTHRASHAKPNQANTPMLPEFRSLFGPFPGHVQVGVDARGIQIRLLGHYIEDEEFIKAQCEGSEEEGTDVHTLNWKKLQPACPTRKDAKNFYYAFVLGVQPPKVAQMWQCSVKEAKAAVDEYLRLMPGLKAFKEERIPKDAARGYYETLDGRFIKQPQERLILGGYLQSGEKIVMALARMLFSNRMGGELRNHKVRFINWVHDEFQLSAEPDLAKIVGDCMADCIREAGEILKLKAPMAGNAKYGKNWWECH